MPRASLTRCAKETGRWRTRMPLRDFNVCAHARAQVVTVYTLFTFGFFPAANEHGAAVLGVY